MKQYDHSTPAILFTWKKDFRACRFPSATKGVSNPARRSLFLIQGKLELYGATERIELNLRQGMVMRCGNYLANHLKTGSEPSEALAVHFYPEVLKHIYKDNIPAMLIQDSVGTHHKNQVAQVEVDRMIENYIDGLLFYFNNTELINDELITLKLKELIMLLVNTGSSHAHPVKKILQNLFNPREATLKEVVQAHLFEDLKTEELATLSGLSLSSFKRRFQATYHETPAKYFRKRKLQKASELLRNSTMRVKEICYHCGFNDVSSFTKLFSKYYGASPTKFRQQRLA